jgi:hypothetical protein
MASPGGTDPDAGDFLALSPTPATTPGVLPPGESRGLFVISTRPNLDTAETRPGVRPEDAAGVADQERPERIGALLGNSPNDANEVDLATPGDPADPTEVASAGRAPAFPGITILAGGAGPEDAVDRDRPSGISVVGGSVEPGDPARTPSGAAPTSDTRASRPGDLQTSYGVTVLSTDTGGGGLPRFGVFTDEQVHTVFFDMRRTLADPAPAWTVEYGVPGGSRIQANLDPEAGAPPGQGLLLPFPVERHQPTFPSGIASRFPEQMVIAYGVIGVDGRIGEIGVKQSPDERLTGPVLEALSRWTFRPGRLDGVAVPVKLLLGIPIWVSQ